MPEEAISVGNFCHQAYQESKQGEQVCPRKRFSREISAVGHTGEASEGNRYAQESDFPGKILSPGIPEKQARGQVCPRKRFSRKIAVTGHTRKARAGNRYARGSDFPGIFLPWDIPEKQARGIGMPEEAIIPENFSHRAYQESKRGEQVCPRKRFSREISAVGHTGEASKGQKYEIKKKG